MDRMPPELLLHIFELLDDPAPSQERLHDQPSDDMLKVKQRLSQRLKTVSLVCKPWRALVLPILFRHILWRPKMSSLSAFTLNPIPLLRFLEDNGLDRAVATFTMIVDFLDKRADDRHVRLEIRSVDLEWLWDQLFAVIDPLRFTIIAPPTTLAAFMSRMLFSEDAWSFSIPYHILSLARATREPSPGTLSSEQLIDSRLSDLQVSSPGPSTARTSQPTAAAPSTSCSVRLRRTPACPLFTIRPWTSLLLNEGSSTRAYRTYEFFLRRPPSMLGPLLGSEEHPNDTPLIPASVVDFNYIAIFPLFSHCEVLINHLPRLDRLFMQLTPRPGNRLLEDPAEMKHINIADLWLERNSVYAAIVRELVSDGHPDPSVHNHGNWSTLRVFESGDTADQEAWERAVRFVDENEITNWKVEREGVFVKVGKDGNSPGIEQEVDGHGSPVKPPLPV
ncbi:hypothetical protein AAE478_006387 [Parahypoxylon ruwenzoriense]